MTVNWNWLKAIIHEQDPSGNLNYPIRTRARVILAVAATAIVGIVAMIVALVD